jgi:hypothetical protein
MKVLSLLGRLHCRVEQPHSLDSAGPIHGHLFFNSLESSNFGEAFSLIRLGMPPGNPADQKLLISLATNLHKPQTV